MYTSTFLYFFNEGVLFDVFDVFPKKQLQFEREEVSEQATGLQTAA